ncbi:MAG: hypothetical protein GY749_26930 [Desulfobacteraceae bacterium]|nr:hypothetical protein [Desulfobacteraceae bacterium]
MSSRIIDTNVWVVASGLSWPSEVCVQTCLDWLEEFKESGQSLVVDTASFENESVFGGTVISEMRGNLKEGTYGYDFLNQHLMAHFLFDLTEIRYDKNGARLPTDIHLPGFEPADRKWVALHLEHLQHPPVHNASDGDWIKFEENLCEAGIAVNQLCEVELRQRVADRENL